MGVWAVDAFGNDTACDWAGKYSDEPSIDRVNDAINAVLESEDYLESDVACEALVACEIVARLKGRWGERSAYSERVDIWVDSVNMIPSDDLVLNAINAISRILGENSELQKVYDEEGVIESWRAEMNYLLERVGG